MTPFFFDGEVNMEHYYHVTDWLGTIRGVIDQNGTLLNATDHYPYGMRMPGRSFISDAEGNRYQFTGHEHDGETGYDYHGARYYNSELGKYMSIDPLAAKFPEWSAYNYVLGNPISFIDPDGRAPVGDYYTLSGLWLGSDGEDDNKAYVVTGFCEDTDPDAYNFSASSLKEMRNGSHSGGLKATDIGMTNEELNYRVILSIIRTTEGHGNPLGYDSQFGNNKISNYDDHPKKVITRWGHSSSAAGAYQFLSGTWESHSSKLGLSDFSPSNQDLAALSEIRMVKGVSELIKNGSYEQAITKLSGKWTSLPNGRHQWKPNVNYLFMRYRANELSNKSLIASPKGSLIK